MPTMLIAETNPNLKSKTPEERLAGREWSGRCKAVQAQRNETTGYQR